MLDCGHFVTFVNGGGLGDPPGTLHNSWPLRTDAVDIGEWEICTMTVVDLSLN